MAIGLGLIFGALIIIARFLGHIRDDVQELLKWVKRERKP